jgi:hypothetical protein
MGLPVSLAVSSVDSQGGTASSSLAAVGAASGGTTRMTRPSMVRERLSAKTSRGSDGAGLGWNSPASMPSTSHAASTGEMAVRGARRSDTNARVVNAVSAARSRTKGCADQVVTPMPMAKAAPAASRGARRKRIGSTVRAEVWLASEAALEGIKVQPPLYTMRVRAGDAKGECRSRFSAGMTKNGIMRGFNAGEGAPQSPGERFGGRDR